MGKRLGPVAAACLRSFVSAGHPVIVYSYDQIEDLPDEVQLADAASLVPPARVFRHRKSGSHALFSDYFRYKLLEAGLGIYIDCDMVCLKPVDGTQDYIFGWENLNRRINGAILKIPPDAQLLHQLLALFDQKVFMPPWQTRHERILARIAAFFRINRDIRYGRWGSGGPIAITWYVREDGLADLAQAPEVFYPLHWRQAGLLLDPDTDWKTLVTPRSRCIHLWGSVLKYKYKDRIPRGSPVWHLVEGNWPGPQ
jgi:hypothetical protein